jgi:hypothetical protein
MVFGKLAGSGWVQWAQVGREMLMGSIIWPKAVLVAVPLNYWPSGRAAAIWLRSWSSEHLLSSLIHVDNSAAGAPGN